MSHTITLVAVSFFVGLFIGFVGLSLFTSAAVADARARAEKWKSSFSAESRAHAETTRERDSLEQRIQRLQPTLDLGIRRRAAIEKAAAKKAQRADRVSA